MQVNDLAKWIDELQGNISVIKQQLAALSGSVSDVPDFKITTPTAGQILSYDADHSEFVNSDMPEIPDFDIDTPEDGQLLLYDGSDGKWKNYGIELGGVTTDLLYESENGLVNGTHQLTFDHNVSDYNALYIVYGNTNDPVGTPLTTSAIYAILSGEAVHISAYPAYGNRYFVLDADADDPDVTLVIGSYNESVYLKIFKIYGIKY